MIRLLAPLLAWWDGLTDAARVQWTGVAAAVLLYGLHSILWSPWLIEDAAISYSYAAHAAAGEGWVTYPGGEPVEGFSNPTWTALLATLAFVGISPWFAGSLTGLTLGAATLPLAFLWARQVTDDEGLLPVVAPLWLACSPAFVVWTTAGLENPLWFWLLAAGSLTFLRELRVGGFPWSALPMGLLAITRPEGPLYVVAMAAVGTGLSLRGTRPVGPALARIATFSALTAGVWFAYLGYRLAVFAWPLPNTYYAKLINGREHFQPFLWSPTTGGSGWGYLRRWALWSVFGFLLPLFPLSATGWKGWRGQLGLFLAATLALLLLPGAAWLTGSGFWPLAAEPDVLVQVRVGLLALVAFALPWLGVDRDGAPGRILAWTLCGCLFAFVIYVGGDWMEAQRWVGLVTVPLSVLLADLLATLGRAQQWTNPAKARRWLVLGVGGLPLVAGWVQSFWLLGHADITPYDIGRRAAYMNIAQDRLHVDHATTYDIDMGGIMWWSDDRLVDAAGLVDAPIAHHTYQRPFVQEYLFQEVRPDFLHAHDTWRRTVGLDAIRAFRDGYLQIPDYRSTVKAPHTGNHVRRGLFVKRRWEHAPDVVRFDRRLKLEGLHTPAPLAMPGGTLYVEVGWRSLARKLPPFRAVLVLSNGDRVHAWDLPPAYDWLPTAEWRDDDVVHGFHTLALPDDLPVGNWDLSLMVYDRGGVWAADRPGDNPQLARGEVRWADRIALASEAAVLDAVDDTLDGFADAVGASRCKGAEDALQLARKHLPADHPAQPWNDPARHTALARCYATLATTLADGAAADAIFRARQWDHDDAQVLATGRSLADTWQTIGDAAWAAGDAEAAYRAWSRTLQADPRRASVRKKAEEARDVRLGLTED